VQHVARCKYRTQKNRRKFAIWHYRTNLSGYIFATKARIDNRKKNLLSSNIASTRSRNIVNFGPLAAEIGPVVWGAPANFKGFRVLAALLQRHRTTDDDQTLHGVWPLSGLADHIYTFGGYCSVTEFCQVQNSLCVLHVLRFPIGSVAARHSTVGASQTLRR